MCDIQNMNSCGIIGKTLITYYHELKFACAVIKNKNFAPEGPEI
jgi:hypothetical protein